MEAVGHQKCKTRGEEREVSRTTERKVRGYRLGPRSIMHFEVHPELARDIRHGTVLHKVSISQHDKWRVLETCNVVMNDPALCWIRGVTASPQLAVPFPKPWKSVSQSLKAAVEFFGPFVIVVESAVQLAIKVSPGPKTVPAAGLDQKT